MRFDDPRRRFGRLHGPSRRRPSPLERSPVTAWPGRRNRAWRQVPLCSRSPGRATRSARPSRAGCAVGVRGRGKRAPRALSSGRHRRGRRSIAAPPGDLTRHDDSPLHPRVGSAGASPRAAWTIVQAPHDSRSLALAAHDRVHRRRAPEARVRLRGRPPPVPVQRETPHPIRTVRTHWWPSSQRTSFEIALNSSPPACSSISKRAVSALVARAPEASIFSKPIRRLLGARDDTASSATWTS